MILYLCTYIYIIYIIICNGILFRHTKEILPFLTILKDFEGIMLSETYA